MASLNSDNSLNSSPGISSHWGEIFESHRRWLSTIIRSRLADPHAADDVLQEVALTAISQANQPQSPDKVAPWLYRITVRKIVNHHRQHGRQRRLIESVANQPSPQESDCRDPGTWLLQREIQQSVRNSLEKLSPQDRQLLVLKYTEGWGYEQLAQHLGVSEKTIEYRLLRARRALRAQLTQNA